jgi:hypothetical protein
MMKIFDKSTRDLMSQRIVRLPIIADIIRIISPTYSYCHLCGLPFNRTEWHDIPVHYGDGYFSVCEYCWNHKSYLDNRRAVVDLHEMWGINAPYSLHTMLEAFEKEWNITHINK